MSRPDDSRTPPAAEPREPVVGLLVAQARAQPGRAALTAVLLCVLLVLVLRGVLRSRPARAVAADPVPSPAVAVPAPEPLEALLATPLPSWLLNQAPPPVRPAPARDIFALDLERFAGIGEDPAGAPAAAAVQALSPDPLQARQDDLRQLAAGFRLQAVVTGTTRAAFIDDTLVQEGGEYQGFRVSRIESQRVWLEREAVRIELRMPDR